MATVTKGAFSLDLGFASLSGELSDDDRQCAWELYTEIATRVAVVGKRGDRDATNFEGELYLESLDSLYHFFRECRGIMRRFPVGRIKDKKQVHLGVLINRIFRQVLRPFLEKWNGEYRAWAYTRGKENPFEEQKKFPKHKEFIAEWTSLRLVMRYVENELATHYKLVPLD